MSGGYGIPTPETDVEPYELNLTMYILKSTTKKDFYL